MAHDENGTYIAKFREKAKELGLWLSLGGFHEKVNDLFLSSNRIVSVFLGILLFSETAFSCFFKSSSIKVLDSRRF